MGKRRRQCEKKSPPAAFIGNPSSLTVIGQELVDVRVRHVDVVRVVTPVRVVLEGEKRRVNVTQLTKM